MPEPAVDYLACAVLTGAGATAVQSLVTHGIFGLGLYAAGWAASPLFR